MSNGRKFEAATQLLAFYEYIYLQVDTTMPGVTVPSHLCRKGTAAFQIGHDMAVPIPDLMLDENGWSGTLSFGGKPIWCAVPWAAVWAIADQNGRGILFEDKYSRAEVIHLESRKGTVVRGRGAKPRKGTARPDYLRVVGKAVSGAATSARPAKESWLPPAG